MTLGENYGKEFEKKFTSLCNSHSQDEVLMYRIPDQMSGFKGSKNPCDFIMYSKPYIFWIECKSTVNTSWSLAELDDYQRKEMLKYSKTAGSYSYVLILFVCEPSVFAVPISTIESLRSKEIGVINVNKLRKGKYEEEFYELPLAKTKQYIPDFTPEALQELLSLPDQGT